MHPDDEESSEGLLVPTSPFDNDPSPRRFRDTCAAIIPWVLSAFFFCTTIILAGQLHSAQKGTYKSGFSTDFVSSPPRIPIKTVQRHFTNNLYFNSTSRQLYNLPLSPNETTYIGPPSPEIDSAWHALLHDQYVAISDSEAEQFPAEHRKSIDYKGASHPFFELSVFHNLHCLNEIRIVLDRNYYDQKGDVHAGHGGEDLFSNRVYIDHCVDLIRQALQCHADLTPVPMLPVEGYPGAYLGNGEVHTCRDFEAVREWVRERGERKGWEALGD